MPRRALRSSSVDPGRLWLAADVLEKMVAEAQQTEPLESGGVLLGWHAVEHCDVVVQAIIGPGPNAIHKRTRFEPDSAWQREQIARVYEDSGGRVSFPG
jgi:integrative and conjugative element protein (TIGR02256 family)